MMLEDALEPQSPQEPQQPATPTPSATQSDDLPSVVDYAARKIYNQRKAKGEAIDLDENDFADFVRRTAGLESGFKPGAVSPKGALGTMQVMPDTARQYGLDSNDPNQNIVAGIQYHYDNLRKVQPFAKGDKKLARLYAAGAYHAGPGRVLPNLEAGKSGIDAIDDVNDFTVGKDGKQRGMRTRDYATQISGWNPNPTYKLTIKGKDGQPHTLEITEDERADTEAYLKQRGVEYSFADATPTAPVLPPPMEYPSATPAPQPGKYPDQFASVKPFDERPDFADREITLVNEKKEPTGKTTKYGEMVRDLNQRIARYNATYGAIAPVEFSMSKRIAGRELEEIERVRGELDNLGKQIEKGQTVAEMTNRQRQRMQVSVTPGNYMKGARPLGSADMNNPEVRANVDSLMERNGDASRILDLRAQAEALTGEARDKKFAEADDLEMQYRVYYADVAEAQGRLSQLKQTEGGMPEGMRTPTPAESRQVAGQIGQLRLATGVSAQLKVWAKKAREAGNIDIPEDKVLANKTPREMFELYRKYAGQVEAGGFSLEKAIIEEAGKLPIGIREAAFDPNVPNAGADIAQLIKEDPESAAYIGREFERLKRSREFEARFADANRRDRFNDIRNQANTPEMAALRENAHKTPEGFEAFYTKMNLGVPMSPRTVVTINGQKMTARDAAIQASRTDLNDDQRKAIYTQLAQGMMGASLLKMPGMDEERLKRLYAFQFADGKKGYGFANNAQAGAALVNLLMAARDYDKIDIPHSAFALRFADYESLKAGGRAGGPDTFQMDELFGFGPDNLTGEQVYADDKRSGTTGIVSDFGGAAKQALQDPIVGVAQEAAAYSDFVAGLMPKAVAPLGFQESTNLDRVMRYNADNTPPPDSRVEVGARTEVVAPARTEASSMGAVQTNAVTREKAVSLVDKDGNVKPDAVAREYYYSMGYSDDQIDDYVKQHGRMPGIRKLTGDFYTQDELQRLYDPKTGKVSIPRGFRRLPIPEGEMQTPNLPLTVDAKIKSGTVTIEDIRNPKEGLAPFMRGLLRRNLNRNGVPLTPAVNQMIEEAKIETLLYDPRTRRMRSEQEIVDELNKTGAVYSIIPAGQLAMAMARDEQAALVRRGKEKLLVGGYRAQDFSSPEAKGAFLGARTALTFNSFVERDVLAPIFDTFTGETAFSRGINQDLLTQDLPPEAVLPEGISPESSVGKQMMARYQNAKWGTQQVLELGKALAIAGIGTRNFVGGLTKIFGPRSMAVNNIIGQTVFATIPAMITPDGYVWSPVTGDTVRAVYDRKTKRLRPETWGDSAKEFGIQVATTPFLAGFQGTNPNLFRTAITEYPYGFVQEIWHGGSFREAMEAGFANMLQEIVGDSAFKYGGIAAYKLRRATGATPSPFENTVYQTTVNGQTYAAINELPGEPGQIRTRLLPESERAKLLGKPVTAQAESTTPTVVVTPDGTTPTTNTTPAAEAPKQKPKGEYKVVEVSPLAFEQMLMRGATPGAVVEGYEFMQAPNGVNVPQDIAHAASFARESMNEGSADAEGRYVQTQVARAKAQATTQGVEFTPEMEAKAAETARNNYGETQLRALRAGQVFTLDGTHYLVEETAEDGLVAIPVDQNLKPLGDARGATGQPLQIFADSVAPIRQPRVLTGLAENTSRTKRAADRLLLGQRVQTGVTEDTPENGRLYSPDAFLAERARDIRILPMDVSAYIRNRALGIDEDSPLIVPRGQDDPLTRLHADLSALATVTQSGIANDTDGAKAAFRDGVAQARERVKAAQTLLFAQASAEARAATTSETPKRKPKQGSLLTPPTGETSPQMAAQERARAIMTQAQETAQEMDLLLRQFEMGTLPKAAVIGAETQAEVNLPLTNADDRREPEVVTAESLPQIDATPQADGVGGSFVEGMTFLGEGSEYSAYRSKDGTKVYKFNHGNGELSAEGFNERVQEQLLVNRAFGDGSMRVVGRYTGFDGKTQFPILEANYLEGQEATPEQVKTFLESRGFTETAPNVFEGEFEGKRYQFKDPTGNFKVLPDGSVVAYDGAMREVAAPPQTQVVARGGSTVEGSSVQDTRSEATRRAAENPRNRGTEFTARVERRGTNETLTGPQPTPIAERLMNQARHILNLVNILRGNRFQGTLFESRRYGFRNAAGVMTDLSGVDASIVTIQEPELEEVNGVMVETGENDALLNQFPQNSFAIAPNEVLANAKPGTLLVVGYTSSAAQILGQTTEPNFKTKGRAVFIVTSRNEENGSFTLARVYARDSYKFTMSAFQGTHRNVQASDLGKVLKGGGTDGAVQVLGIGVTSENYRNGHVFTNLETNQNYRLIGDTSTETARMIRVDEFGLPVEDGWHGRTDALVNMSDLKGKQWMFRPEISVSTKGTEVEGFFADESSRPNGAVKDGDWNKAGFDSVTLVSLAGMHDANGRMQRLRDIQDFRNRQLLAQTAGIKPGDLVQVPGEVTPYQVVSMERFAEGIILQRVGESGKAQTSDAGASVVRTWPNSRRSELTPILPTTEARSLNAPINTPPVTETVYEVAEQPATEENREARSQLEAAARAVVDAELMDGDYVRRVGARGELFFYTEAGAKIVQSVARVAGAFFAGFNTSAAYFQEGLTALRTALMNPNTDAAAQYFQNLAEEANDAIREFDIRYGGSLADLNQLFANVFTPEYRAQVEAEVANVERIFNENGSVIEASEYLQNLAVRDELFANDVEYGVQREILTRQSSLLMDHADLMEGAANGDTRAIATLANFSNEAGRLNPEEDFETQHLPLPSFQSEAALTDVERLAAIRNLGVLNTAEAIAFHERQHGTMHDVSRALFPDAGRDARHRLFQSPSYQDFLRNVVAGIAQNIPADSSYAGIRGDLAAVAQEILANGTMGLSSEASGLYPKGTAPEQILNDAAQIIQAVAEAVRERVEANPNLNPDDVLRAYAYHTVLSGMGGVNEEATEVTVVEPERDGRERPEETPQGRRGPPASTVESVSRGDAGRGLDDTPTVERFPHTDAVTPPNEIPLQAIEAAERTMETEPTPAEPATIVQAVEAERDNQDHSGLVDTEEAYAPLKTELQKLLGIVANNIQLISYPGFRYLSVADMMSDIFNGFYRFAPTGQGSAHPLAEEFVADTRTVLIRLSYNDAANIVRDFFGRGFDPKLGDMTEEGDLNSVSVVTSLLESPEAKAAFATHVMDMDARNGAMPPAASSTRVAGVAAQMPQGGARQPRGPKVPQVRPMDKRQYVVVGAKDRGTGRETFYLREAVAPELITGLQNGELRSGTFAGYVYDAEADPSKMNATLSPQARNQRLAEAGYTAVLIDSATGRAELLTEPPMQPHTSYDAYQAAHGQAPPPRAVVPVGDGRGDAIYRWSSPDKPMYFQFRVVSLNDLVASNDPTGRRNPRYDQSLQPRDRSAKSSIEQVSGIAANLSPDELVTPQNNVAFGPPVIGQDMMVESGNGRVMAMMLARRNFPERWAAYTKAVMERASQFGIDPASIQGIQDPVLVTERVNTLTPEERSAFAAQANQTAVAGMKANEQAVSDANLISDEALRNMQVRGNLDESIREGQFGQSGVVAEFLAALSPAERNAMMDDKGALSPAGLERIRGAILARVFNGEMGAEVVKALTVESATSGGRISTAIGRVVPELARLKGRVEAGEIAPEYDITEAIGKAALRAMELSASPLEQPSLEGPVGTPFEENLVHLLVKAKRGSNAFVGPMSAYLREVAAFPNLAQGELTEGARTFATPEVILSRAMSNEPEQGTLFENVSPTTDVLSGPGIIIRNILDRAKARQAQGDGRISAYQVELMRAVRNSLGNDTGKVDPALFPYKALQKTFYDIYAKGGRLTPENAKAIQGYLNDALKQEDGFERDLVLRKLLDKTIRDVPMGVSDYWTAAFRATLLASLLGAQVDFTSTTLNIGRYLATQGAIALADRYLLKYLQPSFQSGRVDSQPILPFFAEAVANAVNQRQRFAAFPARQIGKATVEGLKQGIVDAVAIIAGGVTSTQLLEGDFIPAVRANFGMRQDGTMPRMFQLLNAGLNLTVSPMTNATFRIRGVPDAITSAVASRVVLAEIATLDHINGRDGRSVDEIMTHPTPEQESAATERMLQLLWKNQNAVVTGAQNLVEGIQNPFARGAASFVMKTMIAPFPKIAQNMAGEGLHYTAVPGIVKAGAETHDFIKAVFNTPSGGRWAESMGKYLASLSGEDKRRLIELLIKAGLGWLVLFQMGRKMYKSRDIVPTIGMEEQRETIKARGLDTMGGQIVIGSRGYDVRKIHLPAWLMLNSGALWEKFREEQEQLPEWKRQGTGAQVWDFTWNTLLGYGQQSPYGQAFLKYTDKRRGGSSITSAVVNAIAPKPPFIRQIAQVSDPYKRDTKVYDQSKDDALMTNIANTYKAAIPGVRENLPIEMDVFGDEVMNPYIYSPNILGRFLSVIDPTGSVPVKPAAPNTAEYMRLGTAPDKSRPQEDPIDGPEPDKEYRERIQREGQAIKALQNAVLQNEFTNQLTGQSREVRKGLLSDSAVAARRIANGKSILTMAQAEFNVILEGVYQTNLEALRADKRYREATKDGRKKAEDALRSEIADFKYKDGADNARGIPKREAMDAKTLETFAQTVANLNNQAAKAKEPVNFPLEQLMAMPEEEYQKAFMRLRNAADETQANRMFQTVRTRTFGAAKRELERQRQRAKKAAGEDVTVEEETNL